MMGTWFTDVGTWLESLPIVWAYVALFAIAYGENVLPPLPGDLAILYGGYLAGTGHLAFWPVVALATLGGGLGFMTLYGIGYGVGEAVLDPHRMRWVPKKGMGKARLWIEHWGWWAVAFNRFLSGVRSVISITVGIARMDAGPTAVLATLGALVWTGLIVYAGYAVGDNLDLVKGWMRAYGSVMGTLLSLVVLVLIVRWLRGRGARVDSTAA